MAKRIPVILDTDLGTDIDDNWAIAMLLRCPELDLKMVTTETGDTTYRAKIVGKLLEADGRGDVEIGIGPETPGMLKTLEPYVADYDLKRYPGKVHADGVDAMVQLIMNSAEPITVIGIGPVPTLAEALRREPRIAERSRFVGMFGSVYRGYEDSTTIVAEYNVKVDVPACQRVFQAAWPMVITPLDTCGLVYLRGENLRRVERCDDPLIRSLLEGDAIWRQTPFGVERTREGWAATSCLYDAVAVYLAFADELLTMETLGIRVDDEGYTRIDPSAKSMACATGWKDLAGFEAFLADRLVSGRR